MWCETGQFQTTMLFYSVQSAIWYTKHATVNVQKVKFTHTAGASGFRWRDCSRWRKSRLVYVASMKYLWHVVSGVDCCPAQVRGIAGKSLVFIDVQNLGAHIGWAVKNEIWEVSIMKVSWPLPGPRIYRAARDSGSRQRYDNPDAVFTELWENGMELRLDSFILLILINCLTIQR